MILSGRGGVLRENRASSPHGRHVSRAQHHSAVLQHPRFQRVPPNHLMRPAFDSSYSQYENTSRTSHSSDDVILPPVQLKRPVVTRPSSSRRPSTKRGPRKLPRVKNETSVPRYAWYHEDGSVNLQALSNLASRHSFPRSQAYYERLERITNRPWPQPDANPTEGQSLLQLLDDEELTPRKRESLLQLLLSCDDLDLTEKELEEILTYVSSQLPEEFTPRSCMKKSPSPGCVAVAEKKQSRHNSHESSKSKSVRFQHASSLTDSNACGSSPPHTPRPQSASSTQPESSSSIPRPAPRSSDPFHVPSPALSPRVLGSPDDEVAYFHDLETPLEVSASPELVPEPKITYYDGSGEEIEEEIQTRQQISDWSRVDDRAALCEDSASCPDESPLCESDRPPASPAPEEVPLEHLPMEDTPRVNLETVEIEECLQSQAQSVDSTSPRPQGHILSKTSDSSHSQSVSPRSVSTGNAPDALLQQECADAPPKKGNMSSATTEDARSSADNEQSLPTPQQTPRPESAPGDQSSRSSRKSRHKSSKQHTSSHSRSKSSKDAQLKPREDVNEQKSHKHRKRPDSPPIACPPLERSVSAMEEPQPIPVISLTRGQLPAIPPYSPRIQSAVPVMSVPRSQDLADSVKCQHSPGPSTLNGVESEPSSSSPWSRGKDSRMKIWLTRTDWDRQVEIVE